jgi:hypothetical protein
MIFLPWKLSDRPVMVVELKWDKSAYDDRSNLQVPLADLAR